MTCTIPIEMTVTHTMYSCF